MSFDIFVPGIGQYENIGDIILRRPLLRWLRAYGRIHVFVGNAPDGYIAGLALGTEDVIYKSFSAWYVAGLSAAMKGRGCYAFKPGEIQLSFLGLKEHVSMIPLLCLLRLTGGHIARLGSGARNFAALPRLLMWPSLALSDGTWWRDERTRKYLGHGAVMPDLAFSEGDTTVDPQAFNNRNVLVVSMRGDRESSGREWIEGVRAYAKLEGLTIAVVTQVMRDADLSRRLADTFGGELYDWDGTGHDRQETRLRDLYRRARAVVSDRLHVLIAAYTHGAVPIGMNGYSSDKIDRHFDVIDVKGVTIFTDGMASAQISDAMALRLKSGTETMSRLVPARQRLEGVRLAVGSLIMGKAGENA